MTLKKPQLNIYLGHELFEEFVHAKNSEGERSLGNFGFKLVEWAFGIYRETGSLGELRRLKLSDLSKKRRSRRA